MKYLAMMLRNSNKNRKIFDNSQRNNKVTKFDIYFIVFLIISILLATYFAFADEYKKQNIIVVKPLSETFRKVCYVDYEIECWQDLRNIVTKNGKKYKVWVNLTENLQIPKEYVEEIK